MAKTARIFFAGVGTTFAILAIGFGAGLLMANSAVNDAPAQRRASFEVPPVRVVHPASAEPALQVTAALPQHNPPPRVDQPVQPSLPVEASPERSVKQADVEKSRREVRTERRKRHAERARLAERRRIRERHPVEAEQPREQPGIMAFGDDQPRQQGFFGN